MSTRKTSKGLKIAAAGLIGALLSVAPISGVLAAPGGFGQPGVANVQAPIENVHWRRHCCYHRPVVRHYCCGHHHHHYARNPYYTGLSHAGTITYPIYRIDHYKVDYVHPTYTYTGCCSSGW
jgi:hypothetical protein